MSNDFEVKGLDSMPVTVQVLSVFCIVAVGFAKVYLWVSLAELAQQIAVEIAAHGFH